MLARLIESNKRIALKSLTFRVLILTADGIIVYAITREFQTALTVTIIRNAFAMILYYIHEEYWNKVRWGFKKSKK